MTNERYSTAKKLQSDIDTLEDVNYECIKSDTLRIDFEEFVHEEIIKLKKEFEEL